MRGEIRRAASAIEGRSPDKVRFKRSYLVDWKIDAVGLSVLRLAVGAGLATGSS